MFSTTFARIRQARPRGRQLAQLGIFTICVSLGLTVGCHSRGGSTTPITVPPPTPQANGPANPTASQVPTTPTNSGTANPNSPSPPSGSGQLVTVPFWTVDKGQFSKVHPGQWGTRVIDNRSDWRSFWTQHTGGTPTPAPVVDFSREVVVVIIRSTPLRLGYSTTVLSVERDPASDDLHLTYGEQGPMHPNSPQPGLTATPLPFHIVRVAKTRGQVQFKALRRFPFKTLISKHEAADRGTVQGLEKEVIDHASALSSRWVARYPRQATNVPAVNFSAGDQVMALVRDPVNFYRSADTEHNFHALGFTLDPTRGQVIMDLFDGVFSVDTHTPGTPPPGNVLYQSPNTMAHVAPQASGQYSMQINNAVVRRSTALDFEYLGKGPLSGYRHNEADFGGQALVFENQQDWSAFWAQHIAYPPNLQVSAAPVVDFASSVVVATFAGHFNAGTHSYWIKDVAELATGSVMVTATHAAVQGPSTPSNPYHFIRIARPRGGVVLSVNEG